MRKINLVFALLLAAFSASSQSMPLDSIKAQMIKDWERAKVYTNAYLSTMPADKYSVHPVDSIRSFSEQMLHLASGNIGLSANGTGVPRIFPGFNMEKSAGAQGKDSVTYYVNASYDFVINSLRNMDVAKFGEHIKRATFDETRMSWINKAFEHQSHHRGQCTIYIRLQGVKPPNEMLL